MAINLNPFGSIRAAFAGTRDRALEFLETGPPKASLFNLSSGETKDFFFNPTTLEQNMGEVNYDRIGYPGLSHQRLAYQGNTNPQVPIEVFVDKISLDAANGTDVDVEDFKNYLQALTLPVEGDGFTTGSAPPRVIFAWPNVTNFTAVLRNLSFQNRTFSQETGQVLIYTATFTLEEVRDQRLSSEEVRQHGFNRVPQFGPPPVSL